MNTIMQMRALIPLDEMRELDENGPELCQNGPGDDMCGLGRDDYARNDVFTGYPIDGDPDAPREVAIDRVIDQYANTFESQTHNYWQTMLEEAVAQGWCEMSDFLTFIENRDKLPEMELIRDVRNKLLGYLQSVMDTSEDILNKLSLSQFLDKFSLADFIEDVDPATRVSLEKLVSPWKTTIPVSRRRMGKTILHPRFKQSSVLSKAGKQIIQILRTNWNEKKTIKTRQWVFLKLDEYCFEQKADISAVWHEWEIIAAKAGISYHKVHFCASCSTQVENPDDYCPLCSDTEIRSRTKYVQGNTRYQVLPYIEPQHTVDEQDTLEAIHRVIFEL